jgi:hypothetical protein
MGKLDDINAPLLEDMGFDAPVAPKKSLEGIDAPVLEDTFTTYSQKNNSLDGIAAPILEDTCSHSPNLSQNSANLDDIEAPILEENTYIPESPKKTLDDIEAPVLTTEEAPKADYKPAFTDPDLEEAKKKAKDNAIKGDLARTSSKFDQKESREMYLALKEEQQRDMAKKGGKLTILLLLLGLIGCGCFYLLSTEILTNFKADSTFAVKIAPYLSYASILGAFCSFLLLIPSKGLRALNSFIFFILAAASLLVGIPMLIGKENMALNAGLLAGSVIPLFALKIIMGMSESLELFYKGKAN